MPEQSKCRKRRLARSSELNFEKGLELYSKKKKNEKMERLGVNTI